VVINEGRTGGAAARAAQVEAGTRAIWIGWASTCTSAIAKPSSATACRARAQVFDHRFTWRTEFDLSWSEAWTQNQQGQAQERNIVVVIPGKDRTQAVIWRTTTTRVHGGCL